jgi:Zn-dependent metalloprotease
MKMIAAITLAFCAHAAPIFATNDLKFVKRNDVTLPFYYPENEFLSFTPSKGSKVIDLSPEDILKIGIKALEKELGVSQDELKVVQHHVGTDKVTHIYTSRIVNGVQVDNQHAAVHIFNGQVIAQSASFRKSGNSFVPENIAPVESVISLDEAVKIASQQLGAPKDDHPASNVYIQIPNGKLVYAHRFQVRDDERNKWYQVSVDASNGQLVQVIDYVQYATYQVLPLPKGNPNDGFEVVTDPENVQASPKGWNSDGITSYTDTQGNNVDSRIGGWFSTSRSDGGASLNFSTAWDVKSEPNTEANKRAAIVNNFYLSNVVHDISYIFGFDEASGNFQQKNFQRGGVENDRVTINNQASGSNNANFATPPDGQKPTMNMFTWTFNTPKRDGSLEASVPIHEYTHGISNRLTGGSAQGNCLGRTESGGMGEGWSDAVAIYLERKAGENRDLDVSIGAYVYNNPKGIRQYVYSTNMQTNPMTYNTIQKNNEVHAIGTIWATVLYELYWNFVDEYGFSANWYDAKQKAGNIMTMQLVIGGMKVQPCNPTFLTARDAIISADQTYYGGVNKCLIWKAFAKRGMGTDAVQNGYKNGFKLPVDCN